MISTILGLLFAAISAICAIWGVLNARTTKSTADNIKTFYENLKSKNDLAFLSRKASEINNIYLEISKINCTVFGQRGSKKSEIEFYKEIKNNIDKIFLDFPSGYSEILELLKEVNSAFIYCIINNIELDKVPQDKMDYYVIDIKMHETMEKLNNELSKIKWS